MKVLLAVLADAANMSNDEKLNIMGIFNIVSSPKVPFAHAKMSIALSIQLEISEIGKEHRMRPALVDSKGAVIWEPLGDDSINITANFKDPDMPTDAPSFNLVINLVNVRFDHYGPHAIQIKVDDQCIHEIPVEAKRI